MAADAVKTLEERAISLDGTCSGEHGVGISKKQYLDDELGVNTVALMRTIKDTLDPYDSFNPEKLYPDNTVVMPPTTKPAPSGSKPTTSAR